MNNKLIVLISLITLTTILTRFTGLNWSPPHLSNDEISIAYDAYSISKTLRDEHNQFLPIAFQSHGTYKAPLAIYLTSISVSLLGNSEFSARLPSAILGSLTVLILGLLTYEITKNKYLALVTSTLLAITPWHIYTSRMILETNIALFFLVLGVFLFFYAVQRKKGLLFFASFISFALSMYGYHTEWGLTPLLITTLFILYRKSILENKAYFLGLFIFFLLTSPLFINYMQNRGTDARANTEILFTQNTLRKQLEAYSGNYIRQGQIIFSRFAGTYSSYIEPSNLFFASPNLLPKDDPFQSGLFLAPLLPAIIYGLLKVKKYFGEHAKFVYIWLILSPVIPALTVGEQQVVRNLPFVAPAILTISAGLYEFITMFNGRKKVIKLSYLALIFVSFAYFSAIYYYHYPKEMGENFQYGYKQIADFVAPRYDNYSKIIIDPIFGEGYVYSGVPHLYIPYFTYLDPKYLQGRSANGKCGNCFAKYEIRRINWAEENLQKNIMYVVPNSNIPPEDKLSQMNLITEIKLPNNKSEFDIYNSK